MLAEPVMTNCGMVLPAPGYHDKLARTVRTIRHLAGHRRDPHFSTGYGGYTAAFGLEPDFMTFGKRIAGGLPVAVYGLRRWARRINASFGRQGRLRPHGHRRNAVGNALAIHAMRATLQNVATPRRL